MRTAIFTVLALVAFAMNSILCRLALGAGAIDAASFSGIRLGSGAAMLLLISLALRRGIPRVEGGHWVSSSLLFLYAIGFSLAYVSLSAGTGALLLFGTVQATMLMAVLRSGERPHALVWCGLCLALAGIVYLVLPGLTAPPLVRSSLMVLAGVSWGLYSLRGRRATDPLLETTYNFIYALPLAAVAVLALSGGLHASAKGVMLAVLSGAIASGVGYVIWYEALKGLTATRAATVQLSVPLLAAAGGALLLSEGLTTRLLISAVLILGGVGAALAGRARKR
ncbi:MAG TPA: DMT family transporter [Pyrinomonadaceae bacterium]|nr:DMT family transporter [Pyrinomonadaceae bacterium]